jgi:hypothetical protein
MVLSFHSTIPPYDVVLNLSAGKTTFEITEVVMSICKFSLTREKTLQFTLLKL